MSNRLILSYLLCACALASQSLMATSAEALPRLVGGGDDDLTYMNCHTGVYASHESMNDEGVCIRTVCWTGGTPPVPNPSGFTGFEFSYVVDNIFCD